MRDLQSAEDMICKTALSIKGKSMLIKKFLLMVFVALVSACSSLPAPPKMDTQKGDKVGVLIAPINTFHHLHIGTTVFNNLRKTYDIKASGLHQKIEKMVAAQIGAAGFEPVLIPIENGSSRAYDNLIDYKDGQWSIGAEKQKTIEALRQRYGVKALLVLNPGGATVEHVCNQFGCVTNATFGPGLFTRGFFAMTRAYSAAAFDWSIYSFAPATDLTRTKPLAHLKMFPLVEQELKPQDHKALTNEELLAYEQGIMKFVQSKMDIALKILRNESPS